MAILISAGEVAYIAGTVYVTDGTDISGDTYEVGLSTTWQQWPTTWITPTHTTPGAAPITVNGVSIPAHSWMLVQLLVSATLPTGNPVIAGTTVDLWVRVHDSPEIKPYILVDRTQIT